MILVRKCLNRGAIAVVVGAIRRRRRLSARKSKSVSARGNLKF